jgi:hypothetical protein
VSAMRIFIRGILAPTTDLVETAPRKNLSASRCQTSTQAVRAIPGASWNVGKAVSGPIAQAVSIERPLLAARLLLGLRARPSMNTNSHGDAAKDKEQ